MTRTYKKGFTRSLEDSVASHTQPKATARSFSAGFTIYFAVLVATLSLSVGLAIYDLLVRELTLSQVATQSQYAIFAADTGIECALYWDSKAPTLNGANSVFGTSSTGVWSTASAPCNGQNINTLWGSTPPAGSDSTHATTTFTITTTSAGNAGPCTIVYVGKYSSPSRTIIESHGRNTCAATTPLRVERVLEATY
jgi:hypothetical protein